MNRKLRQKQSTKIYGARWRKVRLQVLERDRGLCQLRLEGCTIAATEVDHVVPVGSGGPWYDMQLLRASCRHCNRKRAGLLRQRSRPKPSQDWGP